MRSSKGHKTVTEYLHEFNHLSRYAPKDVPTDAAKQEKFMDSLIEELQDKLAVIDFPDFHSLVN